ncbi:MAG TPA: Ppx/GppA family phosphatase, partial [Armatimonadota bacterium]
MHSQMKNAGGSIVAFLDIGTNSVRLLVVRINPNHSYTTLTEQKEMVRLGEGEFSRRHLQAAAMERTALVCRKFVDLAHSFGAESLTAVATSATREAVNQEEFLHLLKHDAGLDVQVISGREEARLIFLGVTSGIHLDDRLAVLIDIGGGSTELSVGDQRHYHYLDSLKLGAIRLTAEYLPDHTGPVTAKQYARIVEYVRNAAVRTVQRVRQYPYELGIGTSGTIENLADVAARLVS